MELYGFSAAELEFLVAHFPENERDTLKLSLAVLKSNLPWRLAAVMLQDKWGITAFREHVTAFSAHREKFTGDAIRFVWCEHIVMSDRFGYKRMQKQFVTAPCPCGFESKTKILKREQESSANAATTAQLASATPRAVARRRPRDGGGEE